MRWGKLGQNWLPKCTGSASGLHCRGCSNGESSIHGGSCCLCHANPQVQEGGCVHGAPACDECISHDTMLAMSS